MDGLYQILAVFMHIYIDYVLYYLFIQQQFDALFAHEAIHDSAIAFFSKC